MDILYEDNHLLVVNKPHGQLVQGDQTGRETLLDDGKAWLKQKYDKPGNVFLALVHRLDRLASGVVVLARTSKAASRLSDEIRSHRAKKMYWAKVEGTTEEAGSWIDRIQRKEYASRIVAEPEGQEARLRYQRLDVVNEVSTVAVELETGRHHQIRVQFAHRGHPILGDTRYGARRPFSEDAIALHCQTMQVKHPTQDEIMTFTVEPSVTWGMDTVTQTSSPQPSQ